MSGVQRDATKKISIVVILTLPSQLKKFTGIEMTVIEIFFIVRLNSTRAVSLWPVTVSLPFIVFTFCIRLLGLRYIELATASIGE